MKSGGWWARARSIQMKCKISRSDVLAPTSGDKHNAEIRKRDWKPSYIHDKASRGLPGSLRYSARCRD